MNNSYYLHCHKLCLSDIGLKYSFKVVLFGHSSLFDEENTALHIWVTSDTDSLNWDLLWTQKLLVLLSLGTP